ncbi:hypothetical protein V1478_002280 [Vespula squamosa]|uniref:Uncharacterized protein n=1 Tax=Vespula squamosa TaxID=30214 RepID=A0ABD2BVW8_VESSQ
MGLVLSSPLGGCHCASDCTMVSEMPRGILSSLGSLHPGGLQPLLLSRFYAWFAFYSNNIDRHIIIHHIDQYDNIHQFIWTSTHLIAVIMYFPATLCI